MRLGKEVAGCNTRSWHGFSYSKDNAPLAETHGLKGPNAASEAGICRQIGLVFHTLSTSEQFTGWNGGSSPKDGPHNQGIEMLVGHENNPDNPVMLPHHNCSYCCGHLFQAMIQRLELGTIYLTPWSSGKCSTGSQQRVVMWDLRPTVEWQEQIKGDRPEYAIIRAQMEVGGRF